MSRWHRAERRFRFGHPIFLYDCSKIWERSFPVCVDVVVIDFVRDDVSGGDKFRLVGGHTVFGCLRT